MYNMEKSPQKISRKSCRIFSGSTGTRKILARDICDRSWSPINFFLNDEGLLREVWERTIPVVLVVDSYRINTDFSLTQIRTQSIPHGSLSLSNTNLFVLSAFDMNLFVLFSVNGFQFSV